MAETVDDLKSRLDQEREQYFVRLQAANEDFLQEMDLGLTLAWYDPDLDILSISLGPSSDAESVAVGSLVARVDPDTLKLVGFEVLDFNALVSGQDPSDQHLADTLQPYARRLMEMTEPTLLVDVLKPPDIAGMIRDLVAG